MAPKELTESQSHDRAYVLNVLLPEFRERFEEWNDEYAQERDLGARGEFVGLYRKARKLKTALWDEDTPPTAWRESIRTIAMEIAAHALLLICDLDATEQPIPDTKPAFSTEGIRMIGHWEKAVDCMINHKFGVPGWRPFSDGGHEHWVKKAVVECGELWPCSHAPDGGKHPKIGLGHA